MKKILSLVLIAAMALIGTAALAEGIPADEITVGYIYIGDENEAYTAAHYEGAKAMAEALGLSEDQIIIKWNTAETEACYDAAIDLAEAGCDIIFGNSFNFESYMIEAAREYPDIQFCHATGFQAATCGLENMHNYFTSVYESRYVSGVVAGMKLNEMMADGTITADQCVVGYVGAFPYAEVISGYTAFFLGIRSVCPEATMKVQYTNSWASFDLEKEAAEALIAQGCVLISQHADTTGAPTACEAAGVPCVGYNVSMIATAPNTALTSASIDWAPYNTYAVECVINGEPIAVDWCQGYDTGANRITELNEDVVAEGTAEKVAEVEAALVSGDLKVFDTSTFTIGGETLESLIEANADYAKYADYVSDGYFHESELASAPSFDIIVDGIEQVS